jgi:hypothetical protein
VKEIILFFFSQPEQQCNDKGDAKEPTFSGSSSNSLHIEQKYRAATAPHSEQLAPHPWTAKHRMHIIVFVEYLIRDLHGLK